MFPLWLYILVGDARRLTAPLALRCYRQRTLIGCTGVVDTGMVVERFRPFATDTPLLAGASAVWLTSPEARLLFGRFIWAN